MINREQKREAQMLIYELRAYYPLHTIATACDTTIGVIIDVINGHKINDHLWQGIYDGTKLLSKEK